VLAELGLTVYISDGSHLGTAGHMPTTTPFFVTFQVLKAASMKIAAFWDIASIG
jgi:hypothetical protein